MSLSSQIALFAGGFVLCLAIMISFLMKWNNPVVSPTSPTSDYSHFKSSPKDLPSKFAFEKSSNAKSPKKSWVVFLAPFYAVGICAYILYMVYRITTKQVKKLNQRRTPPKDESRSNLNGKKMLDQNELNILEKRLQASENAVDEILRKACTLMKDTYIQQDRDSSSSDLSDSSDDVRKLRVTELFTTSSANNESHQDSTSPSEGSKPLHHRKIQHRTKKHFVDAVCDLSSSDEENGDTLRRVPTSSYITGSSNSEDGMTCDVVSDLASETSAHEAKDEVVVVDSKKNLTSLPPLTLRVQTTVPTYLEKISLKGSQEKSFLNNDSKTISVGDNCSRVDRKEEKFENPSQTSLTEKINKGSVDCTREVSGELRCDRTAESVSLVNKSVKARLIHAGEKPVVPNNDKNDYCPNDEGKSPCFVKNVRNCYLVDSADQVETVAATVGESIDNETEKKKFLNEKVKLMHTTKEVLNAMGEIRNYIKEQKNN